MTVGIKFPKGLSSFGKTILEEQENVKELSNLVSMVCGKEMQIKYISEMQNQVTRPSIEENIQKLRDLGVDIIVSGSYVYNSKNRYKAIKFLKGQE